MGVVTSNIPAIRAALKAASQRIADETAADLQNAIRRQIDANGQVDTGALESSVYRVSPTGSTYAEAAAAARDANPEAELFSAEPAPAHGAVVAVAAVYGEPQDQGFVTRGGGVVAGRPFMDPATEQARRAFEARCERLESYL